jgi:hypothetical protein
MILYNPTVSGSLAVTGSLTTTGTITSQTLVVQTITSSVSYLTGSTQHGSVLTNTHQFTGSVYMTGSLDLIGGELKAGRVDTTNEGGQVSFGRATDNATAWYIDAYGNVASPQLRFVDVTGAAVRMTITGSNVGIGTSSPSQKLHISDSSAVYCRIVNTAGADVYLGAESTIGVLSVSNNLALDVRTNNTTRIYVTAGGQVELPNPTLIGKNSNAGSCIGFTENQIYRTGNGILYLQEYSTNHIIALNGGGNFLIGTSTNLGYRLFANGTAAGLSNWNNVSDGRLKKDVTPVINGLDKIKQLNGITFNWDKTLRPDLNVDDKNHLGLIAQDVEAILPQVVTTGDDEFGTKTIAYSDIVPVLIEAIKELSAKNTALEEILQRNNIQ